MSFTVSIALATFNGAAFLEEQLASIAAQTRLPDEMIICDDGSKDETVPIAARFAEQASFEVRLIRNPERLGYAQNFLGAGRQCRSDLIAWSDQDDVWMPEKLARCVEAFETEPGVSLVVHSRRIGDWQRRGRPIIRGGPAESSTRIGRRKRVIGPQPRRLSFTMPGLACVLDRRILDVGDKLNVELPGDFGAYGHDTWTAFLASALGKTVFLPDVLAYYRQHEANVFGAPEPSTVADRLRASARRDVTGFEAGIARAAVTAAFRADILNRLAVEYPEASSQAARWGRLAETHTRRLNLYRAHQRRLVMTGKLMTNAAHGDYLKPRAWGGLGVRSFARDLQYIFTPDPAST